MSDLRVSLPKPCAEKWDDMAPRGCNRHCEQCDQVIHDLSQLTMEEAEGLLRSGREVCVRARVAADGAVQLKRSKSRNARRMVAAIGTSVGILAAGPVAAAEGPKLGAIKGAILGVCGSGGTVTATAADGRVYHAKIGMNGRYKVKRLPAGDYQVKVDTYAPPSDAGATSEDVIPPAVRAVAVQPGRTSVLDLPDPSGCIIIGVISIDHSNG